ncbi:hypothetical protein [Burkholderia gladioli]|uniref:hypothetical protein n=1 Tax=Burkholderia gladioli TaxID=28095 RepID=UPI00163F1596|nr:hypothetical protein [Burkholderia gladioli]
MQQSIRRLAQSDFHVVPSPDHPLLLSGPDILVGGDGKLTAIFIVRKSTVTSALRGRITAARLALPDNARLIAVGDQPPQGRAGLIDLLRHFDEVLLSDRNLEKNIAIFCTSDAMPKTKRELTETKRIQAIRFATLWQIALLRGKHDLKGDGPGSVIETFRSRELNERRPASHSKSRRLNTVDVGGSTVAALPQNAETLENLRAFLNTGLPRMFTLDDGTPYTNEELPPSILLSTNMPVVRHDPEKAVRAAAFGGWVTAQPTNSNDIEELIARTRISLKRRMYERTSRKN